MMRTMIHGACFGPEYWTYYLRNHLPHNSLLSYITPFERLTHSRPDLSHIRVFGRKFTVKEPKNGSIKLADDHTTTGFFLNFLATDHNIIFEDDVTHEIKTTRHIIFDKAHFSGLH